MNSVVDVFDFVTEASVCIIVCRILNINNTDDISDALPDDKIDRLTVFLTELLKTRTHGLPSYRELHVY